MIGNNRPEFQTSLYLQYCQYLDRVSVDMGVKVTYSTAKTVGDKIIK